MITFQQHDGGREDAGFRGRANDCVTRAMAIAMDRDYMDVYKELSQRQKAYCLAQVRKCERSRPRHARYWERRAKRSSARNGMLHQISRPYLKELGWEMTSGYTRIEDFPEKGTFLICQKGHMATIKDGVLYDKFDCRRYPGRRSSRVLAYFVKA